MSTPPPTPGPTGPGRPAPDTSAPEAEETLERPGGRRSPLRSLLSPRVTTSHVLVAVLCAGLGFGVVTQVRQTQGDALATMRQDDLVRLLDELTQRNGELSAEQDELRQDLGDLRTSSTSRQAAQEAAASQARIQGVLAGTLPVHGPGITLTIEDPGGGVRAQTLVTILEELRNAGTESVELSGRRLTASSWILDNQEGPGVVVDGEELAPPYEWKAIGDPSTLAVALGIPGGALATVRNAGGQDLLVESDEVRITAVRELPDPRYATPAPADGEQG